MGKSDFRTGIPLPLTLLPTSDISFPFPHLLDIFWYLKFLFLFPESINQSVSFPSPLFLSSLQVFCKLQVLTCQQVGKPVLRVIMGIFQNTEIKQNILNNIQHNKNKIIGVHLRVRVNFCFSYVYGYECLCKIIITLWIMVKKSLKAAGI